jgi:anti-anti-sigma factor
MNDVPDEITVQHDGSTVLACLTGEIDHSNTPAILEYLREIGQNRTLIVDLTQTKYLDSAGLAMLAHLRHATDLRLRVAQDSIAGRVLSISGLDQIIPTDTDRA